MAACDHVMSVVKQNHKADDPADGDGSDEDPEQASLEAPQADIRARRVRPLRLGSGRLGPSSSQAKIFAAVFTSETQGVRAWKSRGRRVGLTCEVDHDNIVVSADHAPVRERHERFSCHCRGVPVLV
jgi:hypothetical protein